VHVQRPALHLLESDREHAVGDAFGPQRSRRIPVSPSSKIARVPRAPARGLTHHVGIVPLAPAGLLEVVDGEPGRLVLRNVNMTPYDQAYLVPRSTTVEAILEQYRGYRRAARV
jgi:hypothetical protein